MKTRTHTYNKGASDERNTILRHVIRLASKSADMAKLVGWLRARRTRYDKRAKGIGK